MSGVGGSVSAMKRRAWRIDVHDFHIDLVINGRVIMHSEEYANPDAAKRAARTVVDAINHRPLLLRFLRRGRKTDTLVTEEVRRVWNAGKTQVAMPADLAVIPLERQASSRVKPGPVPGK